MLDSQYQDEDDAGWTLTWDVFKLGKYFAEPKYKKVEP